MVWKTIPQAEDDGDIPGTLEVSGGGGFNWGADSQLTIDNSGGDPPFYVNVTFRWPVGTWDGNPPQFRITNSAYAASNLNEGWDYLASAWSGSAASGDPTIYVEFPNQAPPGSGNPATSDQINTWTPNPIELRPLVDDIDGVSFVYATGDTADVESPAVPFTEQSQWLIEVWVEDGPIELNCDCDSPYWFVTLGEMVRKVLRRMGMGAQVNNPPPGVFETVADYIDEAQRLAIADFDEIGHKRYFTWEMAVGQRFFGFDENVDLCTKMLNQIQIDAVYVKRDTEWTRLRRGIDPLWYSGGIHNSYPTHYDVRQCIEVWPPASEASQLIIFGKFKNTPMVGPDDPTTADPDAIFLRAVALYKAAKGHPDASVYMNQYTQYIGNVNADEHRDNFYIPPDSLEECRRERLTRVMDPLVYGDEP